MSQTGFTGISFPFRINKNGNVVTNTTSSDDSSHIEDSIRQILLTSQGERTMESDFYSTLEDFLFEPNNETLQDLIKSSIIEDLERLEDRIEVDGDKIAFTVKAVNDVEYLYVTITYRVIRYDTYQTTEVNLGEVTE